MKAYLPKDVQHIYNQLIQEAQSCVTKAQWVKALKYIETASSWEYNFNAFYYDEKAEQLLKAISDNNIKSSVIDNPINNRCVYLDSWCEDNRGLSQQYLRAMISNGMDILYITVADSLTKGKGLLGELKEYKNATIVTYEGSSLSTFDKAIDICNKIVDFSPKHLLLHLLPWETTLLMACHSIKGVLKYNINLTDHAFWLGASFIDYNIEFRAYGVTVSLEKRGLTPTQLIMLPYYPITPKIKEFKGLPSFPKDSVLIFTGGALYKMLGKNDIFFKIMDSLLNISPNVYIIVAGFNQEKTFDEKCASMRNGNRVVQIGIRSDIDDVFNHVDIYLGTYPMMGGLMSQYAAKHGLPIISYHDKGDVMNYVEEMVNQYQNEFKSFSTMDELVKYATKLIKDIDFRESEGVKLRNGIMTEKKFDVEFKNLISSQKTHWEIKKDKIDYESFFGRYLELENTNRFKSTMEMVRSLKTSALRISTMRRNMIEALLFLTINKFVNIIKN